MKTSSQHNKGLQPVAFLVHAAHKARYASDDSERFAQIAEQVEVTLLEVCDAVDDESLEHIAKALGEGVERAELLGTFRGVSGLADFASICLRIKMGFGRLANPTKAAKNEISALVDLIEARRWHSDALFFRHRSGRTQRAFGTARGDSGGPSGGREDVKAPVKGHVWGAPR